MKRESETATTRRLRVTLINHCYVAAENQKNLTHLAKKVDLQAIVPKWVVLENGKRKYGCSYIQDSSILIWRRPFYPFRQCILQPFGRLLAKHNPDIIHIEYGPWSPLTVETAMLASHFCPKAKLVLTVKKNTYLPKQFFLEQIKTYLRKRMDKKISGYIATSEMAKNLYGDWLGVDSDKIYVCHNLGVDLDIFSPVRADSSDSNKKTVVGYCGRLDSKKGVPELIEAVRKLVVEKGFTIKLRLLGKGGCLRHKLEKKALNIPWLSIEGPVPHKEVAAFLQKCDIFAFPSRNEPDHQEHDAHALMEAMAVGLPSVTTKSGIIPEITDINAALFVHENSPSELAESISMLINSTQRRLKMGRHARLLAEQYFGLSTTAKGKTKIYKEIINA